MGANGAGDGEGALGSSMRAKLAVSIILASSGNADFGGNPQKKNDGTDKSSSVPS